MSHKFYNQEGWRDNVSNFVTQSAGGITEPAFEDIGNGLYCHGFTNGEALVISHHIDHDVKPGGNTFFHVHWSPSTIMSAGETLTWNIQYNIAAGHHQGETLSGSTTTLNLVYVADGTEIAGEHMVVEASTPIVTPEPDSIIISKITYDDGTYGAKAYGLTMDLHYEVDRNSTPNKSPNFYV